MTTFTALTTLKGRERAQALADAMEELAPQPEGIGVFEIEDGSGFWEIGGYFTQAPDGIALSLLAAAFGAAEFAISELPETDWVAKVRRELAPVEAGRFFVYGSHDSGRVPEGCEPLLIEAAMAFGTGHHGTTLGCLLVLENLLKQGFEARIVADIGCGTAVLAMAAARVWPARIVASDIDPVAVDVARANLAANGLEGRMECVEAAGFDCAELRNAAPFDLIFANILKAPLIALAPEIAANLSEGGVAILSGVLTNQADDVIASYRACGLEAYVAETITDWATIKVNKP